MADREKTDTKDQGEGQPKKGRMKLIVMVLAGVLVLGVGGFFGYSKLTGKMSGETTEQPKTDPLPKVALRPFVVNLLDDGEFPHYFKVEFDLVLKRGSSEEEVKTKLGEIRDTIIVLLSSKRRRDLISIEGKDRLRDEIINRVNSRLQYATVSRIFFEDFIIQ